MKNDNYFNYKMGGNRGGGGSARGAGGGMGQVAHVSTIYLMDTTLKDFPRFFLSATKFYNGNHFTSKGH